MPSVFAKPNKMPGLSHGNDLTCEMGKLIPFFCEEALPGDEWKIKTDAVIRLAPMLAPMYGQVDFYTHYFSVPLRTIWDNFEDFITNGLENGTSTAVAPYVVGGDPSAEGSKWALGCLTDYLDMAVSDNAGVGGASVSSPQGVRFSALPLRAYAKIWNDWYRSEFLQSELSFSKGDGLDTTTPLDLQTRCWSRDYLTSALPFTQLGSPALLPIFANQNINVDVMGTGKALGLITSDGVTSTGFVGGLATQSSNLLQAQVSSSGTDVGTGGASGTNAAVGTSVGVDIRKDYSGLKGLVNLYAQTTLNVNEVRLAFQLQRMMERKARSGNRYVEYLASSFGVRSPDARLQRAEFLGGGKSPVMISEVLQTSAGTETSPQGNMAGHGFGASRSHSFRKAFTEHCLVMGILSVMPKATYSQGRPRKWARWTYTDYYQPELAHIGEQAINTTEVMANATEGVFGYQPRYEEYRRALSRVHGDFRKSMAYWTLQRQFSSTSVPLNSEFVSCNPSKRIFAAGDSADRPCWISMYMDWKAIRPIPRHGNPGLIDH